MPNEELLSYHKQQLSEHPQEQNATPDTKKDLSKSLSETYRGHYFIRNHANTSRLHLKIEISDKILNGINWELRLDIVRWCCRNHNTCAGTIDVLKTPNDIHHKVGCRKIWGDTDTDEINCSDEYFDILKEIGTVKLHPIIFRNNNTNSDYGNFICSCELNGSKYYLFINQEFIHMIQDNSEDVMAFIKKMWIERDILLKN